MLHVAIPLNAPAHFAFLRPHQFVLKTFYAELRTIESLMEGYAKLAQLMSAYDEFAILRSFKSLNMQNLLYLQAEITHLEAELGELARRDGMRGDRDYHASDWWSLSLGENANEGDLEQWEKVLQLRDKLDKYSRASHGALLASQANEGFDDALIKQTMLLRLEPPTRHDIKFLRSWFERPRMGSFPLHGLDRSSWDPQYESDLIALKARSAPDRFTRWFTDSVIPKYHNLVGEKLKV
ncbi:MAG: hypothetical protein Q9157_004858 [Trypethelium eluteriae]